MKSLLLTISLIGLVGCDSNKNSSSVGSINSATQNTTMSGEANGSAYAASQDVAEAAKKSIATDLQGVYLVKTDHVESYVEAVTGQPAFLMEILSDKPLSFTTKECDAKPKWAGIAFSGDDKTLTHQYLIFSAAEPNWSEMSEGDTPEFPITVTHIQSDEVTLEDALLMRPGELIPRRRSSRAVKSLQFAIPPIDIKLRRSVGELSVSMIGARTPFFFKGPNPRTGADRESIELLEIGRDFIEVTKEGGSVRPVPQGGSSWQPLMTFGIEVKRPGVKRTGPKISPDENNE